MGIMELTQDGTETCDPFKQCPGILRYVPDRVTKKKCENMVLVTSIKDLIALSSQKHHYHVICLPHGTSECIMNYLLMHSSFSLQFELRY